MAHRPPVSPIPVETLLAVREALGPVVERTLTAVAAENPVYAAVIGTPEGLAIRLGVEQAMRDFLLSLERGGSPPADAGETWRRLGEAEFQAGRNLDPLRLAFRSGTLAVWREAARVAGDAGLASAAVIELAAAIFLYADELAAEVVSRYVRAQSDEAGERERRRRRLATLLLDVDFHDPEQLERAAALARWPVPRRLAVLAISGEPPSELVRRLPADVLSGSDREGGWILVPDPDGPGAAALLTRALSGRSAALGPTVPPSGAARSLRWARATLKLAERGALAGGSPSRSDDHLATLALLSDEELARELTASRLAPLRSVAPADRRRLTDTLAAWLAHQRHTPSVAAELHVHPQTVRYRIATLRELLGEGLETPDGRFELELALRIERLLEG